MTTTTEHHTHRTRSFILAALQAIALSGSGCSMDARVARELAKGNSFGWPHFSDPQLESLRMRYESERPQVRASPDEFIVPLDRTTPCALPTADLEVLIFGSSLERHQAEFWAVAGDTLAGNPTLEEVRVGRVTGSCDGGILEGPAKLTVAYTVNTEWMTAGSKSKLRMINIFTVEGTFHQNRISGPYTKYATGDTETYLSTSSGYTKAPRYGPQSKSYSVTYGEMQDGYLIGNNVWFSETPKVVDSTYVTVAEEPGKWRRSDYAGERLHQVWEYDNFVPHGEYVRFEYTVDDFTVPEVRTCWVMGEKTKKETCDVN